MASFDEQNRLTFLAENPLCFLEIKLSMVAITKMDEIELDEVLKTSVDEG